MNDHEHRTAAVTEIERFARLTGEADLATPIPTCPGWTVADLVRHVGSVQRWGTELLRTLPQGPTSPRDVDLAIPADPSGYRDWLAAAAAALTTALREADGDAPCWAFGPDQHVRFWFWRVLHEVLVHRVDLELALGRTPVVEPEVGADGVEEFLTTVLSRKPVIARVRELGRDGATVHLHATDAEGEWTITLGAEGPSWERGHAKGTAAVRGPAADLLLLVWGRHEIDERFAVFGDEALLSGLLTAATV